MITPEDVRTKASRKFPALCRSWVLGDDPYPMPIRANLNPSSESESDRRDDWKRLVDGSKERTGKGGYVLEFKEVRTRLRGMQSQPSRLVIPTREDHLALIGKAASFQSFCHDVEAIRDFLIDEEGTWCAANTTLILRYPGDWENIVQVVRYLEDNPQAAESLREIPVADSKFTESRRQAVLALAGERSADLGLTLEHHWGGSSNWRPTIRFLDPDMRFGGLSRMTIELTELASLVDSLKPKGLFIIENRTSFDALPEIPGILALWGEGNAVQALGKAGLPADQPVFYWGDIDREGLAILGRLRRMLPRTRSVAMDVETFENYEGFTVLEDSGSRTSFEGLDEEERALYRKLEDGVPGGSALRLEQERIEAGYAVRRLERCIRS
ncbi:MAG: DUF2220 family protein [Spirochaetaceae bacterium]|nr:DUF2220 family protein [Spirochaetaceae bacterium]MDT8298547.1 DUF2220 family protein [Spirochaetaceae bacterium]